MNQEHDTPESESVDNDAELNPQEAAAPTSVRRWISLAISSFTRAYPLR